MPLENYLNWQACAFDSSRCVALHQHEVLIKCYAWE